MAAQEDVTRKVQYSANDPSVIEVGDDGQVKALRSGETAVMVRTLGKAAVSRMAVISLPPTDQLSRDPSP